MSWIPWDLKFSCFLISILTGCLLTLSQFFHSNTHRCRKSEAILKRASAKEESSCLLSDPVLACQKCMLWSRFVLLCLCTFSIQPRCLVHPFVSALCTSLTFLLHMQQVDSSNEKQRVLIIILYYSLSFLRSWCDKAGVIPRRCFCWN